MFRLSRITFSPLTHSLMSDFQVLTVIVIILAVFICFLFLSQKSLKQSDYLTALSFVSKRKGPVSVVAEVESEMERTMYPLRRTRIY